MFSTDSRDFFIEKELAQQEIEKAWANTTPEVHTMSQIGALSLDAFQSTAHENGLLSLDRAEINPNRWNLAASLANKLAKNPTRTMSIQMLQKGEGILSMAELGGRPLSLSENVRNTSNKISFTFGMPYVFNEFYMPTGTRKETDMAVVVLHGENILARNDLQIPFVDAGILHRDLNPLREVVAGLEQQYPDLLPTPLEMFYSFILQDRARKEVFQHYMEQVHTQYSLTPDLLEDYLTQFLAHSFPLARADVGMARRWKGTYAPEGNVAQKIPLEDIKAIIVSADAYNLTSELVNDSELEVISAGPSKSLINKQGFKLDNFHLLRTYAKTIDASEITPFLDLFMDGEIDTHYTHKSRRAVYNGS